MIDEKEFDALTPKNRPYASEPTGKLVNMFFAQGESVGAVVSELAVRARKGDNAALGGLLLALQKENKKLSRLAAKALGLVGKPALDRILSTELLDPSKREGSVRDAALAALAEIGKNDWNAFVEKLFVIVSEGKISNNLTGLIEATVLIALATEEKTAREAVSALMFASEHPEQLVSANILDNLKAIADARKEFEPSVDDFIKAKAKREEEAAREKQRILEKNANGSVAIARVPIVKVPGVPKNGTVVPIEDEKPAGKVVHIEQARARKAAK
ncbi:MAG: hypothetical protein QXH27_00120 [Candidatus Micrarchaeia archaeon]